MARASDRIIQGPILQSLLALAGPIVLANVFQTVYQLTDTFWVGRLGVNAVAAVSLSFPIIFLMISLGSGLSVAGTILVAQYEGRGEIQQVNHVAAQTLVLTTFVSVGISLLGWFTAEPIMRLMGAAPDVLPDAVTYLKISYAGMVFLFGYFVFQSLMRGVGDVKTPALIVFGTVLLNFVLDPLFILGWGPIPSFGVGGAAMATLGTQGLAAVIGVGVLFSGRYGIKLTWQRFRPDWPLANRMLRLGFPASVEQSTRALGLSLVTFLVAAFGSVTVAAYGIGVRIVSFVIIPALGLSMATSTMVGQNIGAGRLDRAEHVTWISTALGFGALSLAGICFFVFARPVSAAFIPDAPDAIAQSTRFIRIMALTFGMIGVQQVLNGAFRGSGNTLISMVLAIVSLWVLRFPLAYVLAERTTLGAEGIWWAFPISNVAAAAIALIWFWRGTWKERQVVSAPDLREHVHDEVEVETGRPDG